VTEKITVLDGWAVLARAAANKECFAQSAAIADTTAFLILRNQLMLGVRSGEDVARMTAAVGPAVMEGAVRALASYEVRRILDNIDAGAARLTPEDARQRLLDFVPNAAARPPAALAFDPPAIQPMRRHKALGARRLRT
jgi:hypothetical protein